MRPLLRLAFAAAIAAAPLAAVSLSANAQSISSEQRGEIERIIKDYLMRNPEVLQEAIAELEKKQSAAEAAKHQAAVKDNKEAIFNSARQVVAGNPQGDVTFVEFFDYNCGYCKRFEKDLQSVDNVTIYLFLYPILSPDSAEKSRNIWCAKDQAKAWQEQMLNSKNAAAAES